mgnify:CR=1 FL=1
MPLSLPRLDSPEGECFTDGNCGISWSLNRLEAPRNLRFEWVLACLVDESAYFFGCSLNLRFAHRVVNDMIEIFKRLPQQQRDLASQHEGVVRMLKLAHRYRQLVGKLTGQQVVPSPVPALVHVPLKKSRRSIRRRV